MRGKQAIWWKGIMGCLATTMLFSKEEPLDLLFGQQQLKQEARNERQSYPYELYRFRFAR